MRSIMMDWGRVQGLEYAWCQGAKAGNIDTAKTVHTIDDCPYWTASYRWAWAKGFQYGAGRRELDFEMRQNVDMGLGVMKLIQRANIFGRNNSG